jgi:hypothetical protein
MKKVTQYVAVVAALALLGSAAQSFGMAENWSCTDAALALAGGTVPDPAGSLVELGILNGATEAQMLANQDNISFLTSHFSVYGSGTVGTGVDAPGDGLYTLVSFGPGAGFFSAQAYVLTFNAATSGAATQVGLFSSADNAWKFPPSDSAGANTIDLGNEGVYAVVGGVGGTIVGGILDGAPSVYMHQVIPEPSSIALAALGLLGLIGLIRRRS